MRKLIGSALLAAALVAMPAAMYAQDHEFGVDLGIGYSKPSGGNGAFQIGIPYGDVRVGFMSSSKMMVEGRLAFGYASISGGVGSGYDLMPGVNVLFALGGSHKEGPFFDVGGLLEVSKPIGGTSGIGFSIDGGIGTRKAWGSAAWRLEAFVQYDLESTDLGRPNTFNVGARIGASFWH